MVSARYHIVSLAAVLFALAAGVVLGAGPLAQAVNEKVATPKSSTSTADASASAAAVASLRAANTYDEAALTSLSGPLLAGRLAHGSVVLVLLPGTPRTEADAVGAAVRAAGGSVTGEVLLTAAWADPSKLDVLAGIADQLAPPDAKAASDGAVDRAAGALAAALVTRKGDRLGRAADTSTALLSGLGQGGFLTTQGEPARAASLAILLAPVRPVGAVGYLPLARALGVAGGGSVVAGPAGSAGAGGLVGAVRALPADRAAVSTVDCVDLAAGRLAVVLALVAAHGGTHGQYGIGPAADAALPNPKVSGG